MRYLGGVVAVAALVLLYKLWLGRRSKSDDNANNNMNTTTTITSQPEEDSYTSSTATSDHHTDSADCSSSLPPGEHDTNPNTTSQQSDSITSSAYADSDDSQLTLPAGEYEVFLSFRGPDTRDRITDILYRFLLRLKIHTFKDDEELRKGEGIWPGLVRAIDQSKIYVPIFSENYAHSKWCLKELVEIVRRNRQPDNKRVLILPIFYKVDPRNVRHQTGSYKEAFQQHEKNFDKKITQEWKDALKEAGSLKGWHVKSDNEQGQYAELVLDSIWSYLRRYYYSIETDELVAIDGHIEELVKRLSLDSKDVRMVGLHGIGGIGKTTLAKAIYNKILPCFDRCSFLENIRETQQKDGLLEIQKKLIRDTMRKEESIVDVSEGRRIITDRVSQFKILIVLDDIDEKFKFEEILGNPQNFVSGTRFIITSRNYKLLSTLNEDRCELYDVQALSHPHALQLFCKHAFKKDSFPPDYEILSNEIVSATGGLPLTLKVVGSLLYREGKSAWKEKLTQLREIPERDVIERLKVSYDALEYEAKEIFLDIACLYIGEKKERPFYMWSDCHFFPTNNISLLIQRSMIKIGDDDTFQMHDQLRDMGREIVRRENIEYPWMRSRIWIDETAQELLHKKKGTEQVKALIKVNSRAILERFEVGSECFVNLSGLRHLEACNTMLIGDFHNLLPSLRWLGLSHIAISSFRKHHPPIFKSSPFIINFHMHNLVILDLSKSLVQDDWGGWTHLKKAKKLKVLDLSYCHILTKLPELPESGSLEVLDLTSFNSLEFSVKKEELDISNSRNLMVLRLRGACIRKISGGTIGMVMKGLRELDVSYCQCQNLGQVLADVGELQSLEILRTERQLGSTDDDDYQQQQEVLTGKLPTSSLKVLTTSSPIANLSELMELEELTVTNCEHGLQIPTNNGDHDDSHNNKLLMSWWKSSKLKYLELGNASKIWSSAPSNNNFCCRLPSSLTEIVITQCRQLEWLPSVENLEKLTTFIVEECPMPPEIQGLGGLNSLQTLRISHAANLRHLDGLNDMQSSSSLTTLELDHCGALERLPSNYNQLASLRVLRIIECPLLTDIPLLGYLVIMSSSSKLQELVIQSCPRLTTLSLTFPTQLDDDDGNRVHMSRRSLSLQCLIISGCKSLTLHVPHLSNFPRLRVLELQDMRIYGSQLEGLDCLEELVTLKLGNLQPSVERLPSLSKLGKLETLCIRDMSSLLEIEGLSNLKSLKSLDLRGCRSLRSLTDHHHVEQLTQLEMIDVRGCNSLTHLSALISNLPAGVKIYRNSTYFRNIHTRRSRSTGTH